MATHSLKKGRFTISQVDTDDKIDLKVSTSTSIRTPNHASSHHKSSCNCKRDLKRRLTSIDTHSYPSFINPNKHNVPSEKNLLDIASTEPMISPRLSQRNSKFSSEQLKDNEVLGIVEAHMCKMFSDMLHIHRDIMVQILDKDSSNTIKVDSMFRTVEELARQNLQLELENKQLMNRLDM